MNGSKNRSPYFHRAISIQIDSPLPQDETQAVSRQSDVELHNKSSPNLIYHVFCLNLDGFKNKTPCFHRTISIQIYSPLPQDDIQAVSRRSDVVLHNKSSPNLTLYLTCLWFWMALKRKIRFHRTISIQINNPLPQDETQTVSRQSDVELYNKSSPNLTLYLTCLWFLIALKRKLPVSQEQFQFRLTVHYPRMTLKQFQDNLMLNYIIKALQISYSTSSVFDFKWL